MALSPSICGVILSAGFSTRMGRDKALLPWPPVAEGTPAANTFLGATIDLLQAYADLVIVVAGKNAPHITPVVYAHGGFLTVNRQPELGQFSSLQAGLQAVLNQGRDAAFIALIDRPPALPRTVKALREAFLYADPDVWAVVPEVMRGGQVSPWTSHPDRARDDYRIPERARHQQCPRRRASVSGAHALRAGGRSAAGRQHRHARRLCPALAQTDMISSEKQF